MIGKTKVEIVQEAMDRIGGSSRVFATWRTVHEGSSGRDEAHPFRGTGMVLDFQRSDSGVYEWVGREQ